MMGMLAAVEAWTKRDHPGEWKTWLSWLDNITKKIAVIPGVTTSISEPTGLSNRSPVLHINWDPAKLNITGEEVAEELGRNKPRVAIGGQSKEGSTSISVTTGQMQPGNDKVVAERIYAVLSRPHPPKKTSADNPSANMTGSWEATIEFFSSTSTHMFFIEQDGAWLKGSHKGDFSVRELTGTMEADIVKMRSIDRRPGDSITFIFSGNISGDSLKGSVFMGEYRTATFTAKRSSYKIKKQDIVIPGGPPLAT